MAAELADVPRFTGADSRRWCDRVPRAGEPKTRVEVGTTVWFGACLGCWSRFDNLMRAAR